MMIDKHFDYIEFNPSESDGGGGGGAAGSAGGFISESPELSDRENDGTSEATDGGGGGGAAGSAGNFSVFESADSTAAIDKQDGSGGGGTAGSAGYFLATS